MKKLFVLVAAVLLILAASCDTKNIGTTPFPNRGPVLTVTVPADMNGGEVATWTVTWVGGTAGYTISLNMGGGTTVDVPAGTAATSPFTQDFTMVNPSTVDPATYTYVIVVTDSLGQSGTATAQYTVGPMLNQAPVIDTAVFDPITDVLTVTVSDPDTGETLDVTVTEPAGLTADATTKTAAQTGPLTATFAWSATDLIVGGTGDTDITVTDGSATSAATTVTITVDGIVLAEDQLGGVPTQTVATTADTVTIVVLTGDIAAAKPFQFMNGCGVTVETGGTYAANTFNVGVPAGAAGDTDGFWTNMNPGGGFLLPPDNFIQATDIGGGRHRIDFNLTPIGGSDVTGAGGALFNFGMDFAAAGTYTLGFQEIEGVDRTYYTDGASNVYYWGDITNNYAGVANSITVT